MIASDNREERRFRAALARSNIPIYVVADHYRSLGHRVELPPVQLRPHFEKRAGYGDEYELLIDRRWKIELKERSLAFTGANDFPYETIFVDRVEKADSVIVHGYISVSESLTHLALVKTSETRKFWEIVNTFDVTKGYSLRVYTCPIALVCFTRCKRSWVCSV